MPSVTNAILFLLHSTAPRFLGERRIWHIGVAYLTYAFEENPQITRKMAIRGEEPDCWVVSVMEKTTGWVRGVEGSTAATWVTVNKQNKVSRNDLFHRV